MVIHLRGRLLVLLGVLLLAWPVRAQAPRLLVVLARDTRWAEVPATADVAVGGLSDPAVARGEADLLLTLGAGGRNVSGAVSPTGYLVTSQGWRLTAWEAIQAANIRAHAGTAPGALGEALRGVPVVLAAAPADAVRGMLLLADRHGEGTRWIHTANLVPSTLLAGAVVVAVAPATGGQVILRTLRTRFPDVPLLLLTTSAARRPALLPVLLYGRGGGLLTSVRTRWQGVVSALDVAPTLLTLAGVPMPPPLANPLTVTARSGASAFLRRLDAQAHAAATARLWLLLLWSVLLFCTTLAVARTRRGTPLLLGAWGVLILFIYGLPTLWFLPLPLLLGLLLAGWGGWARLCARQPLHRSWAATTGLAGLAYFLTTLTNGVVARVPFLGLDLLAGHRYFGVGNEGMGLMIVLLTLWAGWLRSMTPRWSVYAIMGLFSLLALFLVLPWWGANWGGGMTALIAGLVVLGLPVRLRLTPWHLLLATVALLVAGAALIVVMGLLNPQVHTHSGDLGQAVLREGWAVVATTLARKAAFIAHTITAYAGWLILLGGLVYGLLLRRAWRRLPIPLADRPLWQALLAVWIIALLAGLVNDSGMTLTGLMWLTSLPAFALLYLHVPLAPPGAQC